MRRRFTLLRTCSAIKLGTALPSGLTGTKESEFGVRCISGCAIEGDAHRNWVYRTPCDRLRLAAIISAPSSPPQHVWRAQIVLLSADATGPSAIMSATGKSKRGLSHEGCVRRTNSPPDCLLILLTPAYKDLSGFDFAASEINEASLSQLHKCEFMDGAQNVVLIGGPGTGKTHAATALGVQAVEHHRRKMRFFSTIELVNALEQEKAKLGSLPKALPSSTSVLRDLIPRINS